MKSRFLSLILACCAILGAKAQHETLIPVSDGVLPDSADLAYYGKKHALRGAATVFTLNMGVWAFDRFVTRGDFAYINAHTIRRNFKHGFVWDNDAMGTNMFLHPYHGNLYFNAGRSNGMNFWQSGLYGLGGSLMWEMCMENEYPSYNDIMATPIGGMAMGEVAYRLSDRILDDRTSGRERFWRETSAFIVAPTRGLTRLISGDAFRHRATSGRQFGLPDIRLSLSAGVRSLELRDEVLDKGFGLITEMNMEYGDRYDAAVTHPYDFFQIHANLNLQEGQPVLGQLNIVGRLMAKELVDNERNYLSMGMYQHLDYYDSDTISDVSAKTPYKFCTPASLGLGFIYKTKRPGNWNFSSYCHFNAVLLGGALSDYYRVDNRNYNLGSGWSTKNGFRLHYKQDRFVLSGLYEAYHFFTYKGYKPGIDWDTVDPHTLNAQGDKSSAILHTGNLRMDIRLRKGLYLTSQFKTYSRHTRYKLYPNVHSTTFEGDLMLTWAL